MEEPNFLRRYAQVLSDSRWFSSTPPAFQAQLLGAAQLRSLRAGECLFSRGQAACGIYCVVEGAVGVTGIGSPGKEMLVAHITPGRWFGELSLFDAAPRVQQALAEVTSVVVHVPQATIEVMLAEEPQYWRDFGRLVAFKLRLALLTIEDMALSPASIRLPRRLLLIAEGYGDALTPVLKLKLHQEQLAMMLSISRQTANQILKELEAANIVRLTYGEVEILDLAALKLAARLDWVGGG